MLYFVFPDLMQEEEALTLESNVLFFYFRKQQAFYFIFLKMILKKPLRININTSVNSFHSNSELSW